jgi:phosphoenolpyruvate-protein kinase (PTS system EI component)
MMKKQIRAILVARRTSDVRVLLPFVTTVDDILKSREIINEVFAELKTSSDSLKVGIMIEVPSVALSIEHFLPRVDFVSLGTNDLIQYFFAVNRNHIVPFFAPFYKTVSTGNIANNVLSHN